MAFNVGQKVVCINDDEDTDFVGGCVLTTPKKGDVYVLRQIWQDGNLECVTLSEIQNEPCFCLYNGKRELGFFSHRFAAQSEAEMDKLTALIQDKELEKVNVDGDNVPAVRVEERPAVLFHRQTMFAWTRFKARYLRG